MPMSHRKGLHRVAEVVSVGMHPPARRSLEFSRKQTLTLIRNRCQPRLHEGLARLAGIAINGAVIDAKAHGKICEE
jgi:hypothetical protein